MIETRGSSDERRPPVDLWEYHKGNTSTINPRSPRSYSGTFKKYVWEIAPLLGIWTKEKIQKIFCEIDVNKLEPENGGFEKSYVDEFRLAGIRLGYDAYDVRYLVHATINEIFYDQPD